ncbi:CrcB protein [Caldicoprobacter guelmensis]|uniref:fluoride efflux transporter CrcB n=1 Tax=Caldicoprobacter guelmensis TaxID=1170224 RepID=UPI001958E93A|nr:fluoride efflux transporter CrcB [Caldicoprobacter guelmensis]MBM7581761.1 CrcB protein [Caldicoprobacter guelmensis]
MTWVLIGIGGALGSITRFVLGKLISKRFGTAFPIGTFLINITGAFLLGIVSSLDPARHAYLFLVDGFLGAYTTFSTFMYEGFVLFEKDKKMNAFVYISCSLFLGITFYILGFKLGKLGTIYLK